MLDGRGGNDTAVFSGTSSQYKITRSGDEIIVADSISGRDGTVTLKDIELLEFTAKRMASGKTASMN